MKLLPPPADVAIVGGSIAGAFAAYLLAMTGKKIVLFEAKSFPRHKPCGEGLSFSGKCFLKHYGLWTSECDSNTIPLQGYQIRNQHGRHVSLSLGQEDTRGASRHFIDDFIQRSALSYPNVSILKAKVSSTRRSSNGLWELEADKQIFYARHTIWASGSSPINQLSAPHSTIPARIGYVARLQGRWIAAVPQHVIIHHEREGEIFVTPLGTKSVNISLLAPRTAAERITANEFRALATTTAKELGFESIKPMEISGCPNIARTVGLHCEQGLYVIGDALERFDPVSGLGMTFALCSAERAARSVVLELAGERHAWQRFMGAMRKARLPFRCLESIAYRTNVIRGGLLYHTCFEAPRFAAFILKLVKRSLPRPCASKEFFKSRLQGKALFRRDTSIVLQGQVSV